MIGIEDLPTCSVDLSAVIATEPSQKMFPSQFIEEYLQFVRKAKKHSKFFSILLITSGIEFLGKCLHSNHDWDEEGYTHHHFVCVIDQHMPQYKKYKEGIYNCLRGGFNHAPAPQVKEKKGQVMKIGINSDEKLHLTLTKDGTLIINAEIFFQDFVKAAHKVLAKISNHEFPVNDKVYRPYLYIS